MKSIIRVILMALPLLMVVPTYSNLILTEKRAGTIADAETYSYAFSVSGIVTYVDAKPYYRFIQDTFSKRPSFNETTSKFEILDSPILISETELVNRLNQIDLILTSFTLINSNSTQTR